MVPMFRRMLYHMKRSGCICRFEGETGGSGNGRRALFDVLGTEFRQHKEKFNKQK